MKSSNQKQAEALQLQTQQQAAKTAAENTALQKQIFGTIEPFAKMLMQFGIDPIKFLQSPQGVALLGPVREQIGSSFDQARMNLVDMGAGAGFSPGSGQMTGPLANMFSSEASAQSNALQQLIGQALGLGIQGGNILQGQQGMFSPAPAWGSSINAGQSVIQAPPGPGWGLASAGIGAAGQALGGYLSRPQQPTSCWVAAELYGSWYAPRVVNIRKWLAESENPIVRGFAAFYLRFGYQWAQAIRKHRILRRVTKLLFDSFPGG